MTHRNAAHNFTWSAIGFLVCMALAVGIQGAGMGWGLDGVDMNDTAEVTNINTMRNGRV